MADAEQEAPLVGEEKSSTHGRRRTMVFLGGVALLVAVVCSTVGFMYIKGHQAVRHTRVPFPGGRDVRRLLEMVQDIYEDPQSVFKELKSLHVDNSDPTNIRFTPKNWTAGKAGAHGANASLRNLQEVGPMLDYDYMSSLNLAICVIDGYQSALTVGQIATNIHSLTIACESPYPKDPEQQDFCGGLVSLNLALWGYLACFLEDMVSSCGPEFNLNAGCSLDVTGLLTNSFLAASAGAGMKQNCLPPGGYKGVEPVETPDIEEDPAFSVFTREQRVDIQAQFDVIRKQIEEKEAVAFKKRQGQLRLAAATGGGARRLDEFQMLPSSPSVQQDQKVMSVLQGDGGMSSDTEYLQHRAKDLLKELNGEDVDPKDAPKRLMQTTAEKIIALKEDNYEKSWKAAACALDTQKSAARLAQSAVMMAMAVRDCGATNFEKNGHQGKVKCAIDVTAAIASAGIAASLITISVINCPLSLEFTDLTAKRLCAASIIDLTVAASYIGTSIASIHGTCGTLDTYPGVPGT